MEAEKLDRDALMRKLIQRAKRHAHPPISNYFVGAVGWRFKRNTAKSIDIRRPSGLIQRLAKVSADHTIRVDEPDR